MRTCQHLLGNQCIVVISLFLSDGRRKSQEKSVPITSDGHAVLTQQHVLVGSSWIHTEPRHWNNNSTIMIWTNKRTDTFFFFSKLLANTYRFVLIKEGKVFYKSVNMIDSMLHFYHRHNVLQCFGNLFYVMVLASTNLLMHSLHEKAKQFPRPFENTPLTLCSLETDTVTVLAVASMVEGLHPWVVHTIKVQTLNCTHCLLTTVYLLQT